MGLGGHRRLDLRSDRRAGPGRGPLRRSVPRRNARDRGAGPGAPRGLERGAPPGQPRARAGAQRRPLRGLEEPENLTARQASKLASIQRTNAKLYRAYLLKEQLRQIYRLPATAATRLLHGWLKWAPRCRLPSFTKLARTITEQRAGILAAIEHDHSNARIEQINTQITLIARRAFGLHHPQALTALAMLKLANLSPPLPR